MLRQCDSKEIRYRCCRCFTSYLLDLVRYIHLNPLRARLVRDMTALDKYSFSGHGVVMGRHSNNWQDIDAVLRLFGEKLSDAGINIAPTLKRVSPFANVKI